MATFLLILVLLVFIAGLVVGIVFPDVLKEIEKQEN